MGTFPIKVDIPNINIEPLRFDGIADAFTDVCERSHKIFNGEGDKSDMKKSTEADFYAAGTYVQKTVEKTNLKYINCDVDRIIFNPPATIVFWKDGSKTVVKCHGDQTFNPYYGFCAALAKHVFKSNSAVNRMVDKYFCEAVAKKVGTKDTDGDDIENTLKKNSRKVTSLDDDYVIGRFCDTCKYWRYHNSLAPCRECIHTGNNTGISYWTEQEDK